MNWDKCSLTPGTKPAVGNAIKVPTINCIGDLIVVVLNSALAFAGIIIVVMIIFAGYKFITSRGDAAAIDSARKTIIFAIVGLFVIMLSYAFISLIVTLLTGHELGYYTIFQGAESGPTGPGGKK